MDGDNAATPPHHIRGATLAREGDADHAFAFRQRGFEHDLIPARASPFAKAPPVSRGHGERPPREPDRPRPAVDLGVGPGRLAMKHHRTVIGCHDSG